MAGKIRGICSTGDINTYLWQRKCEREVLLEAGMEELANTLDAIDKLFLKGNELSFKYNDIDYSIEYRSNPAKNKRQWALTRGSDGEIIRFYNQLYSNDVTIDGKTLDDIAEDIKIIRIGKKQYPTWDPDEDDN